MPPSITIDHVQVAEIEKNSMTLSIKISGESLSQKKEHYWILEQEENLLSPNPENQDKGLGTSH